MSPYPVLARSFSVAVLLASLVTGAAGQAARLDVLNNRGEVTPLAGAVISSETLDEVRYERAGSGRSESRPTRLVVAVVYGSGGAAYDDARDALARGDLTNAVNLFSAASSEKEPGWVAAHALLGLAEAQALSGRTNEALATMDQFLADYPEHRLVGRALLQAARYASTAGDKARADADVQKVIGLVNGGKLTADWAARAQIEKGQNLLDAGDASGAGTAFTAAQGAARNGLANLGDREDLKPELERLALQARSGQGSALLAGGDLNGARTYFDNLMRDGQDDPAIRAAALNGKAEADFKDDGRLKDAQYGFARVAVLGAGSADEHAKALYYLGQCCLALGEAGEEKNGREKATQYFKDVERRYPASRWARLAREALP